MQDGDIEVLVEQACRVADTKLMGGDHYRMSETRIRSQSAQPAGGGGGSRDGAGRVTPNLAYGSSSPTSTDDLVEMEEFAPGLEGGSGPGGLPKVGMDANDPVVQRCMAEVFFPFHFLSCRVVHASLSRLL